MKDISSSVLCGMLPFPPSAYSLYKQFSLMLFQLF